jgi:hypothetical protein
MIKPTVGTGTSVQQLSKFLHPTVEAGLVHRHGGV